MEERKFKNAPVSELVCGVRVPKGILSISLIAEIYNHFKEEFPLIEEEFPFSDELLPSVLYGKNAGVVDSEKPTLVRYWFLGKDKNRLIQLQDGAIYCNWRKVPGSENNYPKFKSVFNDFINVMDYIVKVTKKNIDITGAEITYLNHIYPDKLGLKLGRIDYMINQTKLTGVFENINAYKIRFNLPVEELSGIYFIDVATNQLLKSSENIIIWNHGIKAVQLKDDFNLVNWFDSAHNFINDRFLEITTEHFKKSMGFDE